MKKIEFSKLIFLWLAGLATTAAVFTMAATWHTGDLSPLSDLLTMIGSVLAVAVGFYYWKARAENRIKLRKKHGAEIYNDAMEDTDYE